MKMSCPLKHVFLNCAMKIFFSEPFGELKKKIFGTSFIEVYLKMPTCVRFF